MFNGLSFAIPSPLQSWQDPLFDQYRIQVWIKRDDLIHPVLMGNKWRKLKYNLIAARDQGNDTLLSFGGAYSNHLHALAGAGALLGFKTVAVLRGELPQPLNPMLMFCKACGMTFYPISRKVYREKDSAPFLKELAEKFNHPYIIPEGGANQLAVQGASEIVSELSNQLPAGFTKLICASATATTLAGVVNGLQSDQFAIGIAVLKAKYYLQDQVRHFTHSEKNNWQVSDDYAFGGYAKISDELVQFMLRTERALNLKLDPIYTAKVFYALKDMVAKGKFLKGERIVLLHSGGIYGRCGFKLNEQKVSL